MQVVANEGSIAQLNKNTQIQVMRSFYFMDGEKCNWQNESVNFRVSIQCGKQQIRVTN